jgi:predicted nucleic acid-binding protein
MIVIDASVWVSFYVPQDVNHGPTAPVMRHLIASHTLLFGPGLVLVEVGASIVRRSGPDEARRAVALMRRLPYLRLSTLDALGVDWATRVAIDAQLRGADAIYVALAQRLGVPLVSWDGQQRMRGQRVVPVYTPETLP